ncbi:MAG TPA: hypothetical protein VNO26_10170 [Candidatus Limnocylindria bacterium]|nr:hypothetical protein [Candidatus Limnocylindria bacterium]
MSAPESDNASFQRAWEKDRKQRVAGMRAATAQTERGTDVTGDDLTRLLAGRAHASVFVQTPSTERTSSGATSAPTDAPP